MSFWDWLAYFALGSIIIWLILKGTGIINTPFLIEYYPYFVVTYFLGWQTNKLNIIAREVNGLKKFKGDTIKQINKMKVNCVRSHT